MKIYLASPHTFTRFRGGADLLREALEMKIYLAGGVSGNLKPAWSKVAKGSDISQKAFVKELVSEGFLAGAESRPWVFEQAADIIKHKPFILESYYYIDKDTEKLLPLFGDFLLDSGAFTFMQNSKSQVDWRSYIKGYADFINRNNIEKYFELDVDSVVGYEKVLDFRKELEDLTGRPSIPVWHSNRGKDEFLKACEEYGYVALGGIVGMEWKVEAEKYMPWFIREAHKRGAMIHGLGYTKLTKLNKYHFDSVDSTAWTTGNRFGYAYKFKNGQITKIEVPAGSRISDSRKLALNNYIEWVKFQKYALTQL